MNLFKLQYLLNRLKEPSTHAGMSIILTLVGISQPQAAALLGIGAAISAFLAVTLPEGGENAGRP